MNRKVFSLVSLLLAAALCFSPSIRAQSSTQNFLQPNTSYPAQAFIATAQTGATQILAGKAFGTIEVYGASFTTLTWEIDGSNDGGSHWFALNTCVITTPGTKATTQTTTSNSLYGVNLAGLTNFRIVTSGTFTATGSVYIKVTAGSTTGVI
jgi:hypothetical protein